MNDYSASEFLRERRLSKDIFDLYGVETKTESVLAIPLTDRTKNAKGSLIYRYLDPSANKKYVTSATTDTSRLLYGENLAYAPNKIGVASRSNRELWLCEGIADVWALRSAGIERSVGLMGKFSSQASSSKIVDAALMCKERHWKLVLWASDDKALASMRIILSTLHKRFPSLQTVVFCPSWKPFAKSSGTPAFLLAEELLLPILREVPLLDGVVGEINGVIHEFKEASLETRMRKITDALSHAPFTPDAETLKMSFTYQDMEVYEKMRRETGSFNDFITSNLPSHAGGKGLATIEEWVKCEGSDLLKHALKRGYDIVPLALNERASRELGEGAWVDALPEETRNLQVGVRNHPSRRAIEKEMALLKSFEPDKVGIKFISEGPDECPKGEVIEIKNYLGRANAYLPAS